MYSDKKLPEPMSSFCMLLIYKNEQSAVYIMYVYL